MFVHFFMFVYLLATDRQTDNRERFLQTIITSSRFHIPYSLDNAGVQLRNIQIQYIQHMQIACYRTMYPTQKCLCC